jgi:D-alanine-D-alanine ligase
LRIGIAFDLLPADRGDDGGPDDRFEEFDKPETVAAIAEVVRGEGHDVTLLGDGPEFLRKVLDDPPDFVFNIAEGQGVGRCREARVPAVLEMLGIPYSGSDPLTLAAALDKSFAKQVLRGEVDLPREFVMAPDLEEGDALFCLADAFGDPFSAPVILKPRLEGSSKGVRGRCLADSAEEAMTIARRLADDYGQDVLVEEFIDGDEVTVGLLGNSPADVLGMMRIVPKRSAGRFVYSLEVKRDWANRVDYEVPARLPDGTGHHLAIAALNAYRVLGCRDVARIDFRVRGGVPYFIEANPLPGLAPGTSDLVIMAEGHGMSHADLIRRILNTALGRVGLLPAGAVAL